MIGISTHKEEAMSEHTDNLQQEIQKSNEHVEELKKSIEIGKAIANLQSNEDFKLVFLDGYFDDEEKRIASVLFNPIGLKRDALENIMDQAAAIRNLKAYIQTKITEASFAPDQIKDEEEFQRELRSQMKPVPEKVEE